MTETDEELFAKARAHMEKYSAAASLDRRLWDATVRLVLKEQTWVQVEERGEHLNRATHALPGTQWTFWLRHKGAMFTYTATLPPFNPESFATQRIAQEKP